MQALINFLNERRVDDKQTFTHTMMEKPHGKYNISMKDEDTLFELLANTKECLSLLECQTATLIPVIVDIDLKSNENKKLYNDKHVQNLVKVFQSVLKSTVSEITLEKLKCFIFEKSTPYYDERTKVWKNGFHLHFPQIFLTRIQLEKNILPLVLQKLNALWQLDTDNLPTQPGKVIDDCIYKGKGKSWFLLGCGKKKLPYLLTSIYDAKGNKDEDVIKHIPSTKSEQIKMFSIHLSDEKRQYICSISPQKGTFETPASVVIQATTHNISSVHASSNFQSESDGSCENEDDMNRDDWVDSILEILEEEYYCDRNKWMHLGWILYNIYNGKSEGFERWNLFSQKSADKYDEKVCQNEWQKMEKKNITLGSLKHIARQSNPDAYYLLVEKFALKYTSKCTEAAMTHYDIAKMLHNMYEDRFVCANVAKNGWYEFDEGTWKPCDDGVSLRNKISTTIYQQIQKIRNEVHMSGIKHQQESGSDKFSAEDREKIRAIDKLLAQLKSTPFKKNVMCEAKDLFFDAKFVDNLDANPNLFAFKNGVLSMGYDKETDKNTWEFVPPAPEHYLSLRSPVEFNSDLSIDHPKVKAVIDFFEKIFPNPRIRNYFLQLNSYIFKGGNLQKKVQVWSGVGDNGKSVTEKIFEKLLGPYCAKLPTSLITGKRTSSSSANPELARVGSGQRFAFLQEATSGEKINVGVLKELSGNDTFYARGLFKDGKEMTPMFKLVLVCNEPPKVDAQTDQATWNRIRVVPFESKFVDDPPTLKTEQIEQKLFPIDRQFDEKIPDLLEGLIFLLLHTFESVKKQIYEPEEVTYATQIYKNKNDYFGIFVGEKVKDEPDESLSINDLYIAFKDWYRESNEGRSVPSKQDVKEYFCKFWGKPIDGVKWKGKALSHDTDELLE